MMLLLAIVANAQMSEKQIIQYVQKQSAAGKDQQTIAKELIAKGVSIQQLETLRNKYQSMTGGSSSVSGSEEFSRIRISNAEEKEQEIDYFPFLEQEEEKEDSVKIFGHDIFRNKELSFEPNMNIATPVNYVLGPNDEVILDIYGASN